MTYTREQILNMPEGRGLDALAADVVMGFELYDGLPAYPKYYIPGYEKIYFKDVPCYSTDIAAATELEARTLEKKSAKYISELIDVIYKPEIGIVQFDSYTGEETLTYEGVAHLMKATPEQRTKAAILAMMESGGTGK
ncbi:hypothetical protein M5X04_14640 [Paenibacillus alvei]|uniref:Phage ABA sandwich domain-containing protein n=1 Tax=Paenibacillus alvei TaxID=44250 RepID=A0ABT4E9Z4_PAEAL|nr:hypothetical protein [Paenibacillus alvei]MCY9530557.1 hypothetical protein [Paenibacillus alvei]